MWFWDCNTRLLLTGCKQPAPINVLTMTATICTCLHTLPARGHRHLVASLWCYRCASHETSVLFKATEIETYSCPGTFVQNKKPLDRTPNKKKKKITDGRTGHVIIALRIRCGRSVQILTLVSREELSVTLSLQEKCRWTVCETINSMTNVMELLTRLHHVQPPVAT